MSRRLALDPDIAEMAYDVLVAFAGHRDTADNHTEFVVAQRAGCSEFRFMGALGFGGKFWHAPYRAHPLYVNCYREDVTPERQVIIDRTNAALAELLPRDPAVRVSPETHE